MTACGTNHKVIQLMASISVNRSDPNLIKEDITLMTTIFKTRLKVPKALTYSLKVLIYLLILRNTNDLPRAPQRPASLPQNMLRLRNMLRLSSGFNIAVVCYDDVSLEDGRYKKITSPYYIVIV